MKKIILFLGFLSLVSCGYQPIFSNKDSNFLIEEIIFDKNDKVSLKIENGLNYLTLVKNYTEVIKLKFALGIKASSFSFSQSPPNICFASSF